VAPSSWSSWIRRYPSETQPSAHARRYGAVQVTPGFVGHPEPTGPERRVHIFGGGPGERHFEVVNEPGTIQRERRHEAALHEVDDDGRKPRLDDMGAEPPEQDPIVPMCLEDGLDHG